MAIVGIVWIGVRTEPQKNLARAVRGKCYTKLIDEAGTIAVVVRFRIRIDKSSWICESVANDVKAPLFLVGSHLSPCQSIATVAGVEERLVALGLNLAVAFIQFWIRIVTRVSFRR